MYKPNYQSVTGLKDVGGGRWQVVTERNKICEPCLIPYKDSVTYSANHVKSNVHNLNVWRCLPMTEFLSPQYALSILHNCQLPVLVLDKQGRMLGYNPAFERLVGRSQSSDLQGYSYKDLGNHPARILLSDNSTVCWDDRNATTHHFEIQTIDLPDADRAQARLFLDISRQVSLEQTHTRLNEELKQHILTDKETGLLNERGIMLALEPR